MWLPWELRFMSDQRRAHLEKNIAEAYELIAELEQKLLGAEGPRERYRVKHDIEEINDQIADHQAELEALNGSVTKLDQKAERLKAMLSDHSGFMGDRLSSFVGRVRELDEIRLRIAEKHGTGGYVTITGQAGQGKSCIIARLVEEYREKEGSLDKVAHHFIPFNPGPDHQVNLLRNLMARLVMKYDLSETYVASESRPALRDYFVHVLQNVAEKGGQEVIFIDGLDQIEEDVTGQRDLSFLPTNPPQGVVFVLGTRPNDTLKPLELLKPSQEYQLPELGRADFELILRHHGVSIDHVLADRFYMAMRKNALYLDLVAKELAVSGAASPDKIIEKVADDPDFRWRWSGFGANRPNGGRCLSRFWACC
jgi:uncharacterized coiled-coil protein SlyX